LHGTIITSARYKYLSEDKREKVAAFIIRWIRGASEQPFGYFKFAGALLVVVLIPVCVAYMISSDPARLHEEGGVIETLSVIFWVAAALLYVMALFRLFNRLDRLVFKWFCLICSLAAARELDVQILLRPKHFGRYGVYDRFDWFFSNKFGQGITLKLIWGAIFLALLVALLAPLFILRKPIQRLIREGDTAAGLLLFSIVALAIGFIADDTLRGTHFMSLMLRQAIEETAEIFGAIFFLASISCLLWKPPSQRISV
jgi:hypothetical protein